MPTRFSVSGLIAVGIAIAGTVSPLKLHSGQTVIAKGQGSHTIFTFGGKMTRTLMLARDATVKPGTAPELKLIAEPDAKVVILTDTYDSKPGGLSYCQAGEETFLRVISLGTSPREMLHLKVKSCVDSVDMADAGITWDAKSATLQVHYLAGHSPDKTHELVSYFIGAGGSARAEK